MSKVLQISGLSGVVLTLFGLIAFVFTGNALDPYVLIHLVLGVLCLLAYFITQGGSFVGSLQRRSTRYGLHAALYSLIDRKSTRLNSSHIQKSRMPSSA